MWALPVDVFSISPNLNFGTLNSVKCAFVCLCVAFIICLMIIFWRANWTLQRSWWQEAIWSITYPPCKFNTIYSSWNYLDMLMIVLLLHLCLLQLNCVWYFCKRNSCTHKFLLSLFLKDGTWRPTLIFLSTGLYLVLMLIASQTTPILMGQGK